MLEPHFRDVSMMDADEAVTVKLALNIGNFEIHCALITTDRKIGWPFVLMLGWGWRGF